MIQQAIHDANLRTQLAEMTKRADELDTLTTMQAGGISGLHAQIRELREQLAAMTQERDEVRLRRQETINMAVQLELEIEQLNGKLAVVEQERDDLKHRLLIESDAADARLGLIHSQGAKLAAVEQENNRLTAIQAIDLKNNNEFRGQLAAAQATIAGYEARDKERAEQPAQHWEDGLRCLEDERDQLQATVTRFTTALLPESTT